MRATFTYTKIYNSDQIEILMTRNCKPRTRRYAVCDNMKDAQAICAALNQVYDVEEV